jgi:hypothetical protein
MSGLAKVVLDTSAQTDVVGEAMICEIQECFYYSLEGDDIDKFPGLRAAQSNMVAGKPFKLKWPKQQVVNGKPTEFLRTPIHWHHHDPGLASKLQYMVRNISNSAIFAIKTTAAFEGVSVRTHVDWGGIAWSIDGENWAADGASTPYDTQTMMKPAAKFPYKSTAAHRDLQCCTSTEHRDSGLVTLVRPGCRYVMFYYYGNMYVENIRIWPLFPRSCTDVSYMRDMYKKGLHDTHHGANSDPVPTDNDSNGLYLIRTNDRYSGSTKAQFATLRCYIPNVNHGEFFENWKTPKEPPKAMGFRQFRESTKLTPSVNANWSCRKYGLDIWIPRTSNSWHFAEQFSRDHAHIIKDRKALYPFSIASDRDGAAAYWTWDKAFWSIDYQRRKYRGANKPLPDGVSSWDEYGKKLPMHWGRYGWRAAAPCTPAEKNSGKRQCSADAPDQWFISGGAGGDLQRSTTLFKQDHYLCAGGFHIGAIGWGKSPTCHEQAVHDVVTCDVNLWNPSDNALLYWKAMQMSTEERQRFVARHRVEQQRRLMMQQLQFAADQDKKAQDSLLAKRLATETEKTNKLIAAAKAEHTKLLADHASVVAKLKAAAAAQQASNNAAKASGATDLKKFQDDLKTKKDALSASFAQQKLNTQTQIAALDAQITSFKSQRNVSASAIKDLETQRKDLENRNESLRRQVAASKQTHSADLQKAKTELDAMLKEKTVADGSAKKAQKALDDLMKKVAKYEQDSATASTALASTMMEKKQVDDERKRLQQETADLKKRLLDFQKTLSDTKLLTATEQKKLDALNKAQSDAVNKRKAEESALAKVTAAKATLQTSNSDLEQQQKSLQESNASLVSTNDALRQLTKQLEDHEKKRSTASAAEAAKLQAQITQIEKDITDRNTALGMLQTRKDAAQKAITQLEIAKGKALASQTQAESDAAAAKKALQESEQKLSLARQNAPKSALAQAVTGLTEEIDTQEASFASKIIGSTSVYLIWGVLGVLAFIIIAVAIVIFLRRPSSTSSQTPPPNQPTTTSATPSVLATPAQQR